MSELYIYKYKPTIVTDRILEMMSGSVILAESRSQAAELMKHHIDNHSTGVHVWASDMTMMYKHKPAILAALFHE